MSNIAFVSISSFLKLETPPFHSKSCGESLVTMLAYNYLDTNLTYVAKEMMPVVKYE